MDSRERLLNHLSLQTKSTDHQEESRWAKHAFHLSVTSPYAVSIAISICIECGLIALVYGTEKSSIALFIIVYYFRHTQALG